MAWDDIAGKAAGNAYVQQSHFRGQEQTAGVFKALLLQILLKADAHGILEGMAEIGKG